MLKNNASIDGHAESQVANPGQDMDRCDPEPAATGTSSSVEQVVPAPREFISVDDLAAELGLDRKTCYNAIRERQIPGIRRVRGRIVVHRPTAIDWFRTGRGEVPGSRRKP
jgi:predicted DNA-binding transcriptional regulator AlpA